MHSSVNNHDKSSSILSLKEIFAVVAVFAFVLYLLFPKGDIESLLEENQEHNNLSIKYLESMLLYHPDNVKLKMKLVDAYDYVGAYDKALKLNQQLINDTNDKKQLSEFLKEQYLLEKFAYFEDENPNLLPRIQERLLDYYEFTRDNRDWVFLFGEATNINYTYLKYKTLIGLMETQPQFRDYDFEKMAYYLASTLEYKKRAYQHLISLLDYPQIDPNLQEYALNVLIEHQEYKKASNIAYELFLKSKDDNEKTKFFYLALYALGKDETRQEGSIRELINEYVENKPLLSADVYNILNTLLQEGRLHEVSHLATTLFTQKSELFDRVNLDLALKILMFDSKLKEAQQFSLYAYGQFNEKQYLDQTIQLAQWQGERELTNMLYIHGYHRFHDKKYEDYLLKEDNLNAFYTILGEIYRKKVEQGAYQFVPKLVEYFNYTGELDKAENYFTKLLKHHKNRVIYEADINFVLNNSHFEKGIQLYERYRQHYGINKALHQKVIERLLALKKFKKAYALTKELNEEPKRLQLDLAWVEKDYDYFQQHLWKLEKEQKLDAQGYERLIALDHKEHRDYLYQRAWRNTHNDYYLTSLFYKLLKENKIEKFQTLLTSLNPKERKVVTKNIDFQMLLANYYLKNRQTKKALSSFENALKLEPLRVETHQSYLWFLMDNLKNNPSFREKLDQEIAFLEKNSQLQREIGSPAVVATLVRQKLNVAKSWIQELLQENPNNKEYLTLQKELTLAQHAYRYALRDQLYANANLKGNLSFKKIHLSNSESVDEFNMGYEWKIYKNLLTKLSFTNDQYKSKLLPNLSEQSYEVRLRNSNKKLLWEFTLGEHQAQESYLSSALNLNYALYPLRLNLNAKYHNKTELTPQLQRDGVEDALAINLHHQITQRFSWSLFAQKSQFRRQNNYYLGEATQFQLHADYILRTDYPNLVLESYFSNNTLSPTIAENFSELGTTLRIGNAKQYTLNKKWQPFGSIGLALNDHQTMGTSLSVGVSKMINKKNSLDVLLNYSKGVGVISEPLYGARLEYRF